MNINRISPEHAGVPSENVQAFIAALEQARLSTHSILLAKGDHLFFEKYYAPFHRDFQHRMYSVTKSFVSLAIGFLEQDGLICLDDKIVDYFPEKSKNVTDVNMKNQTIRHMLMMSTAKPPCEWFSVRPDDRVRVYFENPIRESRPSGTIYQYDSSASFVLGALAERLSGKSLTEYLHEKMFDKIGMTATTHFLTCPGGHAWGDSGLLCTSEDLLKAARFVMNQGRWDGEQILNQAYVNAAVSKQIDNNPGGINEFSTQGYGYQFWRTYHDGFFMNGMGCQLAVCIPETDMIMIYTADNQGKESAKKIIMDSFFRYIIEPAKAEALPENPKAETALKEYAEGLKLAAAVGEKHSDFAKTINGVCYRMDPNPMGITECQLFFEKDGGRMEYVNAQGRKTIPFKMCENEFLLFPETGYSDQVGSVLVPGHQYRCAASAAWIEPQKLFIKVQIIDEYFGTLDITLSFLENRMGMFMKKCAEDFLWNYSGFASGTERKSI